MAAAPDGPVRGRTAAPFAIGAVTDEFSPESLDRALAAMAELGMTFAELRVVDGKNIIDHTDAEVDGVRARVEALEARLGRVYAHLGWDD